MRCVQISLSLPAVFLLAACDPSGSTEEDSDAVRDGDHPVATLAKKKYFAPRTKCPSYSCGLNSPFIGHELNLGGAPNEAGVKLLGAHHIDHGEVAIEVRGDELVAIAGGVELTGTALIGLALELEGAIDGTALPLTAKLVEAASTDLWGLGPGADSPPPVPSYKFVYGAPGIEDQLLCPSSVEGAPDDPTEFQRADLQAALFDEGDIEGLLQLNDGESGVLLPHHAVLFAGERFDYETAEVTEVGDPAWFNWGCAGSSAAKLHLTAHTTAGSAHLGLPAPSLEATQAMLYAYTATYCPGSSRMTVPGQPIRITESRGVVPRDGAASFEPSAAGTVEALWGPEGAVCLSNPRLQESTPNLWATITAACGDIAVCDSREAIKDADLAGTLVNADTPVMTFNPAP